MAVVGLDMGNFSSYIGVARAGGVEIVANEYSDRLTPTYVTFDKSTRAIGQASKAMEITNAKNTICNFKRLLGRQYHDTYVQQEKELNSYSIVEGKSGSVNIEVNYLNERKRFTPEQIAGIMFSKLKHITNTESSTKPVDCVIGVPCYFTDAERRAMFNAAQIAGWNCLRLLNETTAVALCYGIYKGDLPEQTEKPRLVAFVDMGYTALQASIVALNKGKLKMIATAFDPSLGGRDFDRIIMDTMRDDFKKRYKIDSYSTLKAKLRLRAECEKAKKLMSSNVQPIPISLECFIDEKDVSGKISRADFEELVKPLLDRIRNTLVHLIKEAKITTDDLESVEIVGGSTRIPAVKQIIQNTFRKSPMTTMNADESVARGCTLMCAILSPTFIVKEFKIEDCQPYPITLSWHGGINEDNEIEVFSRWNVIPSTKILSFYKKEPLTISARYSYPNDIPFSESRIGQYTIDQIRAQPDGTPSKIKVKVRLNRHGIFEITQASIVDKNEDLPEEPMDTKGGIDKTTVQNVPTTNEPSTENKTPTGDNNQQDRNEDDDDDDDEPKKSTTKSKRKGIDLPIIARQSGITKLEVDQLIEHEREMISNDKKEKERSDAKNAVEEYVYDMRNKLDGGSYEKYSDDRNRQKLLNDLRTTENWLYDQGMHQDKHAYVERLNILKNLGDPIRNRYNEAENRQYYMQDFLKSFKQIEDAIKIWQTKSNDKYSHIDKNDIDKIYRILTEKRKWYEQTANRFNTLRQHEDPAVLCTQIKQERDALERECWSILNKPKPKVELPKDTSTDTSRRQAPSSDGKQQQQNQSPQPPSSSSGKKPSSLRRPNPQSNTQQPSMETD
ncbi:unnamed protein product [Rotaria sp. Silwood1]|nr:unnamed protein product [Rotaria sp. Silwood1]CAF1066230.1 unnamed protein product [Rotaria sp. Silwood1]CAF3433258.1 unnamed protein product [Rotaria sp. Silwood1]CAF4844031.1 unnamed protein product [Rotaria sp. Silwood1]